MKLVREGLQPGLLTRHTFKIEGITLPELRLIQGCMTMFKFNRLIQSIKADRDDISVGSDIYNAIEAGLHHKEA